MKLRNLLAVVLGSCFLLASCSKKTKKAPVESKKEVLVPVAKMFEGNTVKLEGDSFVPTKVGNADYYLIYFTASW